MPTPDLGGRVRRRWGRAPRVTAVSILVALASTLAVTLTPLPASADTQMASNPAPITIPAVQATTTPPNSAASPYPSGITISGLSGATTEVTATLNGLSHNLSRDLDILLVGPQGQSTILMADAGNNGPISNATLTFDDDAAGSIPSPVVSGTYKPTDVPLTTGTPLDIWPSPAPAGPYGATLDAFNGTNPNGTWNLYIADDASGDYGSLAGGWSLTVETGVSSFPGTIQLTSVEYRGTEGGGTAAVTLTRVSGDDGEVGVTFATGTGTATANVDYTPVTQTVTFADGDISETVNVPILDDPSVEGIDELIPFTISTPTGGATLGTPASGQIRVQDNDAVANAFPITVPTQGAAAPYPSNIVVAGASGVVTDVDVTLTDVSHTHIRDLDVLLVSPNGTTTLLMQDVGGNTTAPVSNLNLTFSDEAATGIPQTAFAAGTYKPSQFDDEIADPFIAPAPAGPYGTTLATLDGNSPNGTWSLYVVDDAAGDVGDIGGGWALTLETATASAGGPYTSAEGSGVTLSGSTTPDLTGATYEWDVDGDLSYDDATGANPTVSAATLSAIGLGDGPDSSNVRVRVTSGTAVITSAATTLTITNVAPTATFSNNGPVALGSTADVTFTGQSDVLLDTTAGFRYSYDFDDDGDWEVGDGTYAGSSTSASATVPTTVLNATGTFEVNGRILDKDGGFTDYTTTITVTAPPNTAPDANAGPDQEVNPGDTVTLNGTGSTDPDTGTTLTYSWAQTGGTAVTLSDATAAQPTFTAPTGPDTLTFVLTVSDGTLTDTDTVVITVNGTPVADAGTDQLVNLGDTVTLNGTGSEDPDSDALTYGWVQTGGGTVVTLSDPAAVQPTFTAPEGPDVLVFTLTVTDPGGETDTDTVTITVNGPPTADAGPDQDAELGDTVTLNGTGSSDPDSGTTLLYSWIQTAGPAVTLVGSNTANPSFTAPAGPGVITFELTVDDQQGRTDTDEVNVGLNDTPIADAGPDQVADLGQTVTLDGTASSDPEGDPLLYSWIQTAGPAVTLVGSNTANPSFTAPDGPGTITFELTVTDDEGLTDTDTVDVRLNTRPTANAGPDQLVNLGNTVTLDGTASSDPDAGDILRYQWDQTFGPTVTLSGRLTATPTFTAPEGPTELRFRLIVRDTFGRFRTDFVSVVVNGPPSANAGPDRIVDPSTVVILSGSGSTDPDGDTLKYQWTQTFGPTVALSGANTVNATFTAPSTPAELRFRLIVRDQRGRSATDFVQIIVAGPPVANAGPDQTVTSGDVVTLDGSGSSSPVKYQWTQTFGPTVVLSSTTTAMPTFTAPVVSTPKQLRFRLIVRDGRGGFSTDFVHITVNPPV